MAKTKRQSTQLEDFAPEQLEALAWFYPTIRRELNRLGELTLIRLPEAAEAARRLQILRELEARGDLWIRISYAGNLNVMVRAAPDIGEDGSYLGVLRRSATSWCKPAGRYYPDESDSEVDAIDAVLPVDATERAQYRVARIVADEVPGLNPEIARRIAERVMGELWTLLEP
ncbi:MAG: hypothetical protein EPO20_29600 [Betaproteobacteria bacterium]|nr:MAG: hypothetical protein EPO20_29600 [Betaproteobacteria bacterium]